MYLTDRIPMLQNYFKRVEGNITDCCIVPQLNTKKNSLFVYRQYKKMSDKRTKKNIKNNKKAPNKYQQRLHI